MPPPAPELPKRFPCWCQAVYSWGGETKRDLGFVEGDLIECLNAGDGSWWTGRLKRDRRMIGVFPSNFVRVLDDSFVPTSRPTTPQPQRNGSGSASRGTSPSATIAPAKTRSMFRKPFQAYARAGSPNPAAVARELEQKAINSSREPSLNRQTSFQQGHSRPSSSSGPKSHPSRAPGQPSADIYQGTADSPPPPPPPPHRVPTASRAPSFSDYNHANGYAYPTSRGPTPGPPSPAVIGHTPSPLRNAMEDVMSSLQDMGIGPDSNPYRTESVSNPWGPESYDRGSTEATYGTYPRPMRPRTSLGIGAQEEDEEDDGVVQNGYHAYPAENHPSQIGDYVERMETRLRGMQATDPGPSAEIFQSTMEVQGDMGPPPPAKFPVPDSQPFHRPSSSLSRRDSKYDGAGTGRRLRNRKSAAELGASIGRRFTTRSSATSSSSGAHSNSTYASSYSTQRTSQSVMSGPSAGGFSATSAGSYARRKSGAMVVPERAMSAMDNPNDRFAGIGDGSRASAAEGRRQTMANGITFDSNQAQMAASSQSDWTGSIHESNAIFGGLAAPKPKKSGFFKKILETAKTGAASARSSIVAGPTGFPAAQPQPMIPKGVTAIAGGMAARDMGLGGGVDWVQVRRDVNRSNSLSKNERIERAERCQMLDHPVIAPVDELFESVEGDEGADGRPIAKPIDYHSINLSLVDKAARFITSLPPMTNSVSLAQGYVCRPYRSDVQRLRAIYTWVSEKIVWEEEFEGRVDTKRVIQVKRGSAQEVAVLVTEMCAAVGIHAELIRGHLKAPGDVPELGVTPQANHWWNAVVVDGEWRMMDCSLASPSNPCRGMYSSAGSQVADFWWFLARPLEMCYTHIPLIPEQQHICPPVSYEVLMTLPCACPPYFKNGLHLVDFDTSLLRIEELELVHVQFLVPPDVECVAEVEAKAFRRDADGDLYESGDVVRKRMLAQAEWVGGQKRYVVKALLPGDEGHGILRVYAGKRGLMHSIKNNPHPLAFALPIIHSGSNPPYDFVIRHPTPHAQRHDLYVSQPQCARLVVNNTFVFAIRQHPSSLPSASPESGTVSPAPFTRPSSALSMTSSSASTSIAGGANSSISTHRKAAKLAIQSPSGKILRLMRKSANTISTSGAGGGDAGDGSVWETILKISERGIWRGLVLADRSARWCVFAEWECV